FPLEPVVLFATGSDALAGQYRELSPLRASPATLADLQSRPDLRRMRARLGDELREIIYRLGVDPGQVQATASPILPDRARMLAACVALRQPEPAADDPYHNLIQRTLRADEIAWQIQRATQDALAVELQ